MLMTKTPPFYAKEALRLHYYKLLCRVLTMETWASSDLIYFFSWVQLKVVQTLKQSLPSPEPFSHYIHYHSAKGDGEQYHNIKAIISRLHTQFSLNVICRSIILHEKRHQIAYLTVPKCLYCLYINAHITCLRKY